MKNLLESYLQSTREFSDMLSERTPAEVAYDNEVLAGLRKGLSIREALDLAATKRPDEALKVDETTIGALDDHYRYLKSHEDILDRLHAASPKSSKSRGRRSR